MKNSRMKRMAGISSLLMAMALTATGCSMLPGEADTVEPTAPPVEKVADYDPAEVVLDPEWKAAYGEDRELPTQIATEGLKILGVMYDQHPEYTLNGFVPTEENWITVATEFKPLANDAALEYMSKQWTADKTLPVMSSYRTTLDESGEHGYTFTTESGEKCTDSAKQPYEYKNELVTLTARSDEGGTQVPILSSNVSLRIQCQEGTILSGQMYTWFPMQEVDGQWKMFDKYEVEPTGSFKIEPAAG